MVKRKIIEVVLMVVSAIVAAVKSVIKVIDYIRKTKPRETTNFA